MRAGRERHAGSRAQSHPKLAEPRRVSAIRYNLSDTLDIPIPGEVWLRVAVLAAHRGNIFVHRGQPDNECRRSMQTSGVTRRFLGGFEP